MSELFRSVQVGCSRFSRCCHLLVDLSSISRMKAGQAINAVIGTRRLGVSFSFLRMLCLYASTCIVLCLLLRSGSYASPLTHNRRSNTANFHSLPITAAFFPFFPPAPSLFP